MNNLLQEFEYLQAKKNKITLTIISLYVAICLIIISFILLMIFKSFANDDSFLDTGFYILLVSLIIFLTTLYLITRIKKSGWLLLAVITAILWGFSAKIVYFYLTSTWEIVSILNALLFAFVLLASSVLLALLFLPLTLKMYKIDITIITISIFINILAICAILISFE